MVHTVPFAGNAWVIGCVCKTVKIPTTCVISRCFVALEVFLKNDMRYINSWFTFTLLYFEGGLPNQRCHSKCLYLYPTFNGKGKGRGHLIHRLFIDQPHHRGAQVWHALSRDHTVLPATDTFIHEWNEPYLRLPSQPIRSPTPEGWKAELA